MRVLIPLVAAILVPAICGATGLEDAARQVPALLISASAIGSAPMPRLRLAAAQARGSNPRRRGWATIRGQSNGADFAVTINKVQGRITGVANGSEVDLTIDFDARVIEGGANHSQINVRYDWDAGTVKGGLIDLTYANGRLHGGVGGAGVDLTYQHSTGRIDGGAAGHECHVTYDEVSGKIAGSCLGNTMELTADNLTIQELLDTYAFLVFAPRR